MWSEAEAILRATGSRLIEWRRGTGAAGRWEGTQFKAEADRLANEHLRDALVALTPGMPIVSEEDPASFSVLPPSTWWLIDPIDGTASYAEGFSGFVTQIAFMEGRRAVWGAVYAPLFDAMYIAARGRGARLNGAVLATPQVTGRRVLIDNYPEPRGFARLAYDALECTGYLESGSIGLKICRIADGTADLFVKNVSMRLWDVAAPALVLEEAGGVATDGTGCAFESEGDARIDGIVAAGSSLLHAAAVAWSAGTLAEQKRQWA